MKKMIALSLVLLMLVFGCGAAMPAERELRIIVATDPHYIAPGLTDHGIYFTAITENSDGKLMRFSEELIDAFLAEVAAARPDVLLLTGDLTFNGALLSHSALAAKLRELEALGVPVLVQTGNHDVYNANAATFHGATFTRVPSATTEGFRQIYAEFGFDEALSMDTDSISYVVELADGTRVLMLDLNTQHDFCGISDTSLEWVEAQLQDAQAAGVGILAAGHQNLFQHSMFRGGYVIDKADRLASLLRQYGVALYLSGHLHIQHYKTEEGLTEIATGALSVSPCQYGVLEWEGERMLYHTQETDVSSWARAQGRTEPELLDFPRYARDYFEGRSARQVPEELAFYAYTPEEIERMTAYLIPLNRAYFCGDMRDAAALDPTGELYALWQRYPSLYSAYLASIQGDIGMDYRVWENS